MTPEERALAAFNEIKATPIPATDAEAEAIIVAGIAQVLREHGNEKLEAAVKEVDRYTRWYEARKAIRALKDEPPEPKGER